jgi:hypothetical protein
VHTDVDHLFPALYKLLEAMHKRVAMASDWATGLGTQAAQQRWNWAGSHINARLCNGEPLAILPVLRDNVCVDPPTRAGGVRRRPALVGTGPHQTRAETAHMAGGC